jgi:hypothetical protein
VFQGNAHPGIHDDPSQPQCKLPRAEDLNEGFDMLIFSGIHEILVHVTIPIHILQSLH